MLIKARALNGYTLRSLDGTIGSVRDLYFDDQHWVTRYLVAETGNWLTGRQVLISPYAMGAVDREAEQIAINLTRKQIEDSPSLDSDTPVSRQFETSYHSYYGLPFYWSGNGMWGAYPYLVRDSRQWGKPAKGETEWDSHLRSTHDLSGYHIHATDGDIGHIVDFIIDDEIWAIRYLIIDTRNWWPGKQVLISPQWIENVSWDNMKAFVNVPRERIKQSPEYTEESPLTRDYEDRLHRHYSHKGYWVDEQAAREQSR